MTQGGLRYIDVCSGISAPTAAWKPLGWQALCYAEIEAAPRAVLAHHYPNIPLVGDFTQIQGTEYGPVDLLVGGTPCQDFSVSGLRAGLAGSRGNLTLGYVRLAGRARPRWVVWENVTGVLSSDEGRAFGAFLGGLAELGYGFAYRVLDAQYFGLPQKRARVIVVGYLGDWRRAASVLFERESLCGIPAPHRENNVPDVEWWNGKGRALNCIDASYGAKWGSNQWYARGHVIIDGGRPRRATPVEVERCFGFPDGFTDVPLGGRPMPDRHRYKMLGNSIAVPMLRWIGERIAKVDALTIAERQAA